jgi:preprotein translocase subunit SecA
MGLYPQRRDNRDSALDKFAAGAVGFVRQRVGIGHVSYDKLIQQVNDKASGLEKQSLAGLQAHAQLLRRRLYSEGLVDNLVVETFALIREITQRTLNMRQYDVQIYGGWAMLRGMVAEMETGEGKTLTATLPACTAAFAGIPVHIVTVND